MSDSDTAATAEDVVVHEADAATAAEIAAADAKASRVEMIPTGLIERSEVALRDVNRDDAQYILLCKSIDKVGVLNSILVREIAVPGTDRVRYGLIDGLQRYSACMDLGVETVPAKIVDMDDADVLDAQVITNIVRVQQKPAEVSKHLLRILGRNPFMTLDALAEKICQSRTYVEQRLSLTKLKDEIQALVNSGEIGLTNAYALAKLPEEEQAQYVEAAMTEPPKVFVPQMKERVKAIKDAKRSSKDVEEATFKPVQYMQKVSDVKAEFEALESGSTESKLMALLQSTGCDNPVDAVKLAVAWCLHFDSESQAEQARRYEQKAAKKKADAEKRKAEREEKKKAAAAAAAADILKL
jgi:ParB family chromosome partitioning protein